MAFDLFQCFLCLHVKCSDIRARWDWAVRIDPTHCDRSKGCIPQKSRESPSTFSKYIPIELISPFAVLACFAQSEEQPSHLRCVSSNITSMSIVKTKEIPEIKIQSFYFEILPSDMFPAEVYLTWRSAGPPQHPGGDWSVKRGLTSCSLWGECRYCGGGCLRIMNHSPRLSVWAVRRWSAPLCLQWGLFQG